MRTAIRLRQAMPSLLLPALALAFPQNPTLSSLPSNTARNLGSYAAQCADSSFDPDDCRRVADYSRFTYDPDRHRIYFFGGGHSTTMRDDIDVFHFDSLRWRSDYASTRCSDMTSITTDGTWSSNGHPVARHTYDQLIYAPNVHRLIITSPVYGAGYCGAYDGCGQWCAGKMLFYDPDAKTWTPKTSGTNSAHVVSSEYDPVSGRIISAGGPGLSTYDPVADAKADHLSSSPIGDYADNLVYFPPNDKFYYFSRGSPIQVYAVTLSRSNWSASTIQEVTGMSGTPGTGETGWAYDSANHIIGGGVTNGKFYAFDPISKSWTTRTMTIQGGGSAPTCNFHCMEYDPVDQVFIFYSESFETWAYCYARGPSTVASRIGRATSPTLSVLTTAGQGVVKVRILGGGGSSLLHARMFDIRGKVEPGVLSSPGDVAAITSRTHAGTYLLRVTDGQNVLTRSVVVP